jgi:hypothetical protein
MHRSRRAALASLPILGVAAFVLACAMKPVPDVLLPGSVTVRVGQIDAAALESAQKSAPRSLGARTEQLVDALWQAGCLGGAVETPLPRVNGNPDVVCSLPGRSEARILVVAHLDGEDAAKGVPQHWSGVALLPFLYRALAVAPREHTFVFAAFGKSPQRRVHDYLDRLGAPHADGVRAIVELKDVQPASIWFTTADAGLRHDFFAASLAVGRPLETLHFLPAAAEKRAHLATLTVAAAPPPRPGRTPPAVEAAPRSEATSLHATARFVAVFLAYVDETLRLRAEPAAPVATDAQPAP